jgi:hypothetical protein
MQAAFVGWSVPFGVIFAQYLVPWVAVMDVDARGLSNYLISECVCMVLIITKGCSN